MMLNYSLPKFDCIAHNLTLIFGTTSDIPQSYYKWAPKFF